MRIITTSVVVDDQEKALEFYTKILGFRLKDMIPIGDYKWITLTSPEGTDQVELSLEPNGHPAVKAYQKALYEEGIPIRMFDVEDIHGVYEDLNEKAVRFIMSPTQMEGYYLAVFDDTCGNYIQLIQR